MIYEELSPHAADLAGVAECYWRFTLESHDPAEVVHTVPPDGTVSIAWQVAMGQAVVVGPRLEALRVLVKQGVEYMGVRFRPGAAGPLLGVRVADFVGKTIRLAEISSELATEFSAAASDVCGLAEFRTGMDRLLPLWKARGPAADALVAALVDGILTREDASIEELTSGLDVGYRQALRRFEEATGLSPKQFARLRRIRLACVRALEESTARSSGDTNWAAVSANSGFSDQSHLSREFLRTFGWTPTLVHEYLKRIEHVGVEER